MVVIDCFVRNLNPKKMDIFVNAWSKVNFKVNYDFSTDEAWGTSV